jgi:hypothetical protein
VSLFSGGETAVDNISRIGFLFQTNAYCSNDKANAVGCVLSRNKLNEILYVD